MEGCFRWTREPHPWISRIKTNIWCLECKSNLEFNTVRIEGRLSKYQLRQATNRGPSRSRVGELIAATEKLLSKWIMKRFIMIRGRWATITVLEEQVRRMVYSLLASTTQASSTSIPRLPQVPLSQRSAPPLCQRGSPSTCQRDKKLSTRSKDAWIGEERLGPLCLRTTQIKRQEMNLSTPMTPHTLSHMRLKVSWSWSREKKWIDIPICLSINQKSRDLVGLRLLIRFLEWPRQLKLKTNKWSFKRSV